MTPPRRPTLLCVGDLNLDLVITPEVAIASGSDVAGSISMSAGGSAANVAAWAVRAAADEHDRQDVAVRFVGTVGDDTTGAFLVDDLARAGVEVQTLVRAGARSRTVAVIVDTSGNRSIVSDLDPRIALQENDRSAVESQLDEVTWLHLTGYTYITEASRPLFLGTIAAAARAGVPWSIDPSSAELLRSRCTLAEVRAALSGAAALFPSHDEAAYLVGDTTAAAHPGTMAEALLDLAERVAVTCGADGAWIAARGAPTVHVAAAPTTVVNTLGAGDAFAAGFLVGTLTGGNPAHCAATTAAWAVAVPTAH
jgi:sugar/nucleoside kinase (ribokinase family)